MGLNRWTGIGRLGKDPQIRRTQGGMAICGLSIACDERRKDKEGQWQNVTEWVPVKLFDKQGRERRKVPAQRL